MNFGTVIAMLAGTTLMLATAGWYRRRQRRDACRTCVLADAEAIVWTEQARLLSRSRHPSMRGQR